MNNQCDIYLRGEVDKMKAENAELLKRIAEIVHENALLNEELYKLKEKDTWAS